MKMRTRQRSAKPTDRTADLPFSKQRASKKEGSHEKCTPLELKVWRLQQRVAQSIRRRRKVLVLRWGRNKSMVLLGINASLGLESRFTVGSTAVEEIPSVIPGLHVGVDYVGLGNPVFRRAVQVARSRVMSYLTTASGTVNVVLGTQCWVCSGPHATHTCFSMLQKELAREDEHIVIARHRLALESNEDVIREDALRVASSLRRKWHLERIRSRGLLVLGARVAKYGLKAGLGLSFGTIFFTWELGVDLMYIATGVSLARPPRLHRALDILFPAQSLLDYYEAELTAQVEEQPEEDTTVGGPPPLVEIPEPEKPTVPVSNSYKVLQRLYVEFDYDTWQVTKTEKLTDREKSYRLVVAEDSLPLVTRLNRLGRLDWPSVADEDICRRYPALLKTEFHYRGGATGEGSHTVAGKYDYDLSVQKGYGLTLKFHKSPVFVPYNVHFQLEVSASAAPCC